jgi:hypothetical protein
MGLKMVGKIEIEFGSIKEKSSQLFTKPNQKTKPKNQTKPNQTKQKKPNHTKPSVIEMWLHMKPSWTHSCLKVTQRLY